MTKTYPYEPNYRVHPGATLSEVAVWRLAEHLGINATELVDVADGRAPVTQDIADALGTLDPSAPASFWMNLQRNYDADGARIDGSKGDEK